MKGNGWVGLLPNGTWSGMVAQLINKEADISIAQASMIMMINTLSGVSFLHPSSEGIFIALFKQPSRSSSTDLLISAFSAYSWIFYFLSWVIIVVSIHFVTFCIRSSTNECLNANDDAFTKEKIMWAFAFACGKGTTKVLNFLILVGAIRFILVSICRMVHCTHEVMFSSHLPWGFNHGVLYLCCIL